MGDMSATGQIKRDRSHLDNSGSGYVVPGEQFRVFTLDSVVERAVSLLKIDVEGMEWRVLEGAKDILTTFRPVVVIEHKKKMARRFGQDDDDAVNLLLGMGYEKHDCSTKRDWVFT